MVIYSDGWLDSDSVCRPDLQYQSSSALHYTDVLTGKYSIQRTADLQGTVNMGTVKRQGKAAFFLKRLSFVHWDFLLVLQVCYEYSKEASELWHAN